MDITKLRYFLKAAETLNYTHAAESLFVSRQALRQALTALERELGQPLFESDSGPLALTEYGAYLAQAARGVVEEFQRMEADVERFFRQAMTLRVATASNLYPFVFWNFEQAQQEFRRRFPHIRLQVEKLPTDEVLDALEQGEADCGCLLQMPTPRGECTCTVLRTSQVAVTMGRDMPLSQKPALTLEDLATAELIGMGSLERFAAPLWEDCRQRGIRLNYRVVPNTIDALFMMQNNLAMGLNTFPIGYDRGKGKVMDEQVHVHLPGYTWEVAALCPKDRPNHNAALLLAAFLREKYLPAAERDKKG